MKVSSLFRRQAWGPDGPGLRCQKQEASGIETVLRDGGTPILIHTLRKFAASPEVTEIYVALRANEIAGFRARLKADKELPVRKSNLWKAASIASSRSPMR